MKRIASWLMFALIGLVSAGSTQADDAPLKIGIIGLDTSHAIAFTEMINGAKADEDGPYSGCKVVAAYPKGSEDIHSSVSRVPDYTKKIRSLGVEIVDSIDELIERVDAVLLESNDGRPHLAQAIPVFKAKKPCFIDKPFAASLADTVAIFDAAKKFGTPVFTSSSLRYTPGLQQLRDGVRGKVLGCDAYSPCELEKTHPDFYWYGIHGVELLYTIMGTGCESVSRTHAPDQDFAVGLWNNGRIGTFRGMREGAAYGGTVFTAKGPQTIEKYAGYQGLLAEVIKFFRTGKPPVSPEESIEIYTFMEAADESKRQGGKPVRLADVLEKARAEAVSKLADATGG